jgi:hypothetical protein
MLVVSGSRRSKPLAKAKSEDRVHYEQKYFFYLLILTYINSRYCLLGIYDILFVVLTFDNSLLCS